jgi:tetratricopeptide (TPR) repeat protein
MPENSMSMNAQNYLEHAIESYFENSNEYTDEFIAHINEAIRLDPNLAEAYRWRGDMYRYGKNYAQALYDYTEAIRLDPEHHSGYMCRGIVYEALKDYDSAIEDYTEMIRIAPYTPYHYTFRAGCYLASGQYDLALQDAETALKIEPDRIYNQLLHKDIIEASNSKQV